MLTRETLVWLRGLLDQQTINLGHPDGKAAAVAILKAMDELDAAIANEDDE